MNRRHLLEQQAYVRFLREAAKNRVARNEEAHAGQFRKCSREQLSGWLDDVEQRFLAMACACLDEDDGSGILCQLLHDVGVGGEPATATHDATDPTLLDWNWITLSEQCCGSCTKKSRACATLTRTLTFGSGG